MIQEYKTNITRLSFAALFLAIVSGFCFAEAKGYLDPGNWTAGVNKSGSMKANPTAITKEANGLKLAGFYLGKEAQYALKSELAKDFENKLISITVNFNGEFVGGDSSFLALAMRASSPLTIFWNQQCYALLFKSSQLEIQKHGKGTNPNIVFKYSDLPALGFKTFPIGKPVKITYGIVKEGSFPQMVVKVNGVEVAKILDNRYGQTVKPAPNNVFLVGVIATNKEAPGDDTSRSSLTITDLKVE